MTQTNFNVLNLERHIILELRNSKIYIISAVHDLYFLRPAFSDNIYIHNTQSLADTLHM